MFKNVIMFGNKLGQLKNGVDNAPNVLSGLIRKNINQNKINISNNLTSNLLNLYDKNISIDGPKINIGGDHSMSIATVADSLERHKNLRVIWMDAHCDINTYEKSLSKNYHGMPLSILTGIEENKSLNFTDKVLDFKNLLYIGIRDIDPFEKEVLDKYKIKSISISDIDKDINKSIIDMKRFIDNEPVHLSFDVDVLDPLVMPSTGTPVNNGLKIEPCKIILDTLLKENLVSVDITELNPEIGDNLERSKSVNNLVYLFNNYLF